MSSQFLNKAGLAKLWSNVKGYVSEHISRQMFEVQYGLVNKVTDINKSGGVTTSIVETSATATATTTFSSSGDVRTVTTNLVMNSGSWNYRRTVTITTTSAGVKINESYSQIAK